jgi:hypothetical protein
MRRNTNLESPFRFPYLPPKEVGDVTLVDIRKAPEPKPIPSLVRPKQTTPPPNVIPFVKPRAIAAIAAANPSSVVVVETMKRPSERTPSTIEKPEAITIVRPPPPAQARAAATPATPVATGVTSPAPARIAAPMAATITTYPVAPAPRPPTAPVVAQPPRAPANDWAVYDQLGLGAPAVPAKKQAASLIVSAYRMLGFGILTIIVVVLIGYIATQAFFFMSSSWIVPVAVSPTDERVVAVQAQLVEQQNSRDRIADELKQAERAIAVQQRFQLEFAKAIKSDLEGRKLALGRVRSLANAASTTRKAIRSQNTAYARSSRRKMAEEYAAGLIDRNSMLSGNYQLAQISTSNLSLAERQAEFETRAAELEAQTRSLDAILHDAETQSNVALSYEVLRIKQEYESSKLDLARSVEVRDTLKANLERQDKVVKALRQSVYLRAVNDGATVAFVPYSNMSNVAKGKALYACKLGMVFCRKVGEVLDVLQGEVQFKHPHRDKTLRGNVVELKLDAQDGEAAADDVLFVGGKPLLL